MMRTKPKEKTGQNIVRAKRGDEREKKKKQTGQGNAEMTQTAGVCVDLPRPVKYSLLTISKLTNRSMIPDSDIVERRHE